MAKEKNDSVRNMTLVVDETVVCANVSTENMDAYYDFHVNKLSREENTGHVQDIFIMGIIKQTHVLSSIGFVGCLWFVLFSYLCFDYYETNLLRQGRHIL